MASLILTSDTLSVRLLSRRLEVLRRNPLEPSTALSRTEVPLFDLDRVVLIGQPAVTIPVLAELMDSGIPCFFVSGLTLTVLTA